MMKNLAFEKQARTLRNPSGGAATFRYVAADWQKIEDAAASAGLSWSAWARETLAAMPPGLNRTGYLRRVAVETLNACALQAGRAAAGVGWAPSSHPMLKDRFLVMDRATLDSELEHLVIIERHDFGGYELLACERTVNASQGAVPVVVVRSKLESDLHTALFREVLTEEDGDDIDVEDYDDIANSAYGEDKEA